MKCAGSIKEVSMKCQGRVKEVLFQGAAERFLEENCKMERKYNNFRKNLTEFKQVIETTDMEKSWLYMIYYVLCKYYT